MSAIGRTRPVEANDDLTLAGRSNLGYDGLMLPVPSSSGTSTRGYVASTCAMCAG
jgi:hypothetical protein